MKELEEVFISNYISIKKSGGVKSLIFQFKPFNLAEF